MNNQDDGNGRLIAPRIQQVLLNFEDSIHTDLRIDQTVRVDLTLGATRMELEWNSHRDDRVAPAWTASLTLNSGIEQNNREFEKWTEIRLTYRVQATTSYV